MVEFICLVVDPAGIQTVDPMICMMQVICECPASGDGDIDDFVGYELRLGNFRLPVSLSEDLLNAMTRYHLLTDHNLQMFNSKHANLHRVMLNHMVSHCV